MAAVLVKCTGCGFDRYPNQLVKIDGKMVCADCRKSTHGEIQANKRAAAKATAWNNGKGWEI